MWDDVSNNPGVSTPVRAESFHDALTPHNRALSDSVFQHDRNMPSFSSEIPGGVRGGHLWRIRMRTRHLRFAKAAGRPRRMDHGIADAELEETLYGDHICLSPLIWVHRRGRDAQRVLMSRWGSGQSPFQRQTQPLNSCLQPLYGPPSGRSRQRLVVPGYAGQKHLQHAQAVECLRHQPRVRHAPAKAAPHKPLT